MKYSMVLSNTNRSIAYLNVVLKANILPQFIFIFSKSKRISFLSKIKKKKINYDLIRSNSINSKLVIKKIIKSKFNNFIYSGYPGEIVKKFTLKKKNFIHFHPGKLPEIKGSTTIFYSILLKKKIFCSCILLNNKIDEGKILYQKKFYKPRTKVLFNDNFDNFIRAQTLLSYLKNGNQKIKKNKKHYLPYYIAHPIIRSLV